MRITRIFLLILIISILMIGGNAKSNSVSNTIIHTESLSEGSDAVDFTLHSVYNENVTYSLSTYDGKILLIDMFATWCPSCKDSISEMLDLYNMYKDTGKFEILSVDVDTSETITEIKAFHDIYGMAWDLAQDYQGAIGNNTFYHYYGTGYIPTYYLIYNNTIVYTEIGWSSVSVYRNLINNILVGYDTTKPTFNSLPSTDLNDTTKPSIDHPKLYVELNVTDNYYMYRVDANVLFGTEVNTFSLTRYGDIWNGTILFDISRIYDMKNINITFFAEDVFNNNVTSDIVSFPIKHIDDTEPPIVEITKATHTLTKQKSVVSISLTASDNYRISDIYVTEHVEGKESIRHGLGHVYGDTYTLTIQYNPNEDITSHTYFITVIDLGSNNVTKPLNIDLKAPLVDTLSNSEVTSDTVTEKSPFIFSPLFIIAIPILKKYKK